MPRVANPTFPADRFAFLPRVRKFYGGIFPLPSRSRTIVVPPEAAKTLNEHPDAIAWQRANDYLSRMHKELAGSRAPAAQFLGEHVQKCKTALAQVETTARALRAAQDAAVMPGSRTSDNAILQARERNVEDACHAAFHALEDLANAVTLHDDTVAPSKVKMVIHAAVCVAALIALGVAAVVTQGLALAVVAALGGCALLSGACGLAEVIRSALDKRYGSAALEDSLGALTDRLDLLMATQGPTAETLDGSTTEPWAAFPALRAVAARSLQQVACDPACKPAIACQPSTSPAPAVRQAMSLAVAPSGPGAKDGKPSESGFAALPRELIHLIVGFAAQYRVVVNLRRVSKAVAAMLSGRHLAPLVMPWYRARVERIASANDIKALVASIDPELPAQQKAEILDRARFSLGGVKPERLLRATRIVLAGIASLPEEQRLLLLPRFSYTSFRNIADQCCGIIGDEFPTELLEAILADVAAMPPRDQVSAMVGMHAGMRKLHGPLLAQAELALDAMALSLSEADRRTLQGTLASYKYDDYGHARGYDARYMR